MPDPLREYREKRDFDATPEPPARRGRARVKAPRFVVQEHDASRLHWDLRLEHDGALASWALPRFMPGESGSNLVAIRTEDHPTSYLDFHGEIPAGSYGAGTMRMYDGGTYELLKWEPRKVEVELHGERLHGRWALFAVGDGEGDDRWMIHRMGEPLDPAAEPMPDALAPMLATAGTLPQGDGWAYEIKWDGIRALCASEPGRLRLWSRSGADITKRYPELARSTRRLREHRAILDGEIVATDDQGRPDFQALQRRMQLGDERRIDKLAKAAPVTYVIFDVLWLDGASLLDRPYRERREILAGLKLGDERWQTTQTLIEDTGGPELLDAARRLGLEGVIAKRLDSRYAPGRRSRDWVKVKHQQTAELLVGGWLQGQGARAKRIGALLLGEPGPGGSLRYAGRVGSGFSQATLDDLQARLAPLARDASPFTAGESPPTRGVHWVQPRLLAQVAFLERSQRGLLRHPVWLGLRDDVAVPLVLEDERPVRGSGRTATALVDGRSLRVTNLDKVLYPGAGVTKRTVIEYYAGIAPVMTAHLRGRAVTLKRYPDGVDGEAFYEKRAPAHRPDWVQTADVAYGAKTVQQVLVQDAATLVWLAQLAALELHPSLAHAETAERPDVVVFDLDPGPPATIVQCCEVGLLLRDMLAGIGLCTFAKTSGSKGLQLYVPLNVPGVAFDDTKAFSSTVAGVLSQARPELIVDRQSKALRKGKVLIDWLQNDRSKSTVAVYSLRAREQLGVSTPVAWEEVEACAAAGDAALLAFSPGDVLGRVDEHGDLFGDVLALRQKLPG